MVAAWMLVIGSPASASSCPNTGLQVTGLSQTSMENSIACLINEERAVYGVQPVQPNASLRQAALSHSDEMVSQGYFEHTSPRRHLHRPDRGHRLHPGRAQLGGRREPRLGDRAAEHAPVAGHLMDEQPAAP
jgi:hypothetical protein